MCGRYVSASNPDDLAAYFGVDDVRAAALQPSWNVAPTREVYAVAEHDERRLLGTFVWGLVPFWARDRSIGQRMINARAETLARSNAFKDAFERRRCLVPADGFYEWYERPGQRRKQPVYVRRADGRPLAFAGLWERWRGPDRERDEPLRTCTIVTTGANATLADVHDRMPVVLDEGAWDEWLHPDNRDTDRLGRLLVPAPPDLLVVSDVSTKVNDVRNDGPDLLEPG